MIYGKASKLNRRNGEFRGMATPSKKAAFQWNGNSRLFKPDFSTTMPPIVLFSNKFAIPPL